ncbi:MAG TPA: zinc ribbon domain-containing protein [Candidatus Sulfotelmatobacter sp.]|nr:zinc ribbon domain-containing protein [Candidatus Sulfotelmatobacter sp.]
MFCRSCGKEIEPDARFCRFCGTAREDPAAARPGIADPAPVGASGAAGARSSSGGGLEARLRHLFPRHHLQDEFMHLGTIVALVVAVIGFIFGMTSLWAFGVTWLLFAIALLLFLMIRESTLSHVRVHGEADDGKGQRPGARGGSSASTPSGGGAAPPRRASPPPPPPPPASPPVGSAPR